MIQFLQHLAALLISNFANYFFANDLVIFFWNHNIGPRWRTAFPVDMAVVEDESLFALATTKIA
jgi:hypothetical protein